MEDRRIGGGEDNRACRLENMRTGRQEDMGTGQQVVRRTKGQEDRTGGNIHWLVHIPIDVHVLHPAVIVLKLIYSAVNVQIAP